MTKIKVSEAAKMLGVTDQFIRVGLQRGPLNLGQPSRKMTGAGHIVMLFILKSLKRLLVKIDIRRLWGNANKTRNSNHTAPKV